MKALAAACLSACMIVAASAKADPVQLKFAYPSAPNNALFQGMQGWADDVNKEADGAIEVKVIPGGVIGDNSNMYRPRHRRRRRYRLCRVRSGLVGLPQDQCRRPCPSKRAIIAKTRWRSGRSTRKASSRTSSLEFHPLAFVVFPGLVIHSKKPIHTLADMKGMKISVEGRVLSQMMPRLGAAPISLQPGELYQSLQRGLVEAVPQGWPSVPTFHLNEVTNFHLEVPLGFNTGYVSMNNDSLCQAAARRQSRDRQALRQGLRRAADRRGRHDASRRPRRDQGDAGPDDRPARSRRRSALERSRRAGDRGMGQGDARRRQGPRRLPRRAESGTARGSDAPFKYSSPPRKRGSTETSRNCFLDSRFRGNDGVPLV